MIRVYSIAALVFLASLAPASAQDLDSPLIVEGAEPVPLAGARPAFRALAGDVFLLPFALLNRAPEPIWLRRIVFRVPPGLEIVDPQFDRIDNDRDGALDEGDEGFSRIDNSALAWLGDADAGPVQPGESVERAVRVRIDPDWQPGASPVLKIIAGASNGDLVLRAEREIKFELAPPSLDIRFAAESEHAVFAASDTPGIEVMLTVPSGRIDDLALALKGSPSVTGYGGLNVKVGAGLACDGAKPAAIKDRVVEAVFGTCRVIEDSEEGERTLSLSARAYLQDAKAFSDADAIRARRQVGIGAIATSEGTSLATPHVVSGRITGPLIGARLISAPQEPVDAGDTVSASYRLVNRGDRKAENLRLLVDEDDAVDCGSLIPENASQALNGCTEGLTLWGGLEPGESRDATFTIRLRDDAEFVGDMALGLRFEAEGVAAMPMPPVPYALRVPPAPKLYLEAGSDWESRGGIVVANVGDVATVRMEGELPEGQYPVTLRLRGRLVDAQTGVATGPAPLTVETFRIVDSPELDQESWDPVTAGEDGWTVISLPVKSVTVPVGQADDERTFSALTRLSLRDAPEIRAGRLLELTAEMMLFGNETVGGESWIEALIVEPSLDISVRSPDEDRAIEMNASAEIVVLTCNRGTSGAEALILTAQIPDGLIVEDLDTARLVGLRTEETGNISNVLNARGAPIGEVVHDTEKPVVRGVLFDGRPLAPETCAALIFTVRRTDALGVNASDAVLTATVEPFKGEGGLHARIYDGGETGEISFELPPVRFGPVSEIEAGTAQIIAHTVMLEVPPGAGPYRVGISTESTAGLPWTILRLDDAAAATPWRGGTIVKSGETVRLRFEARNPGDLPLGWVDTTVARVLAFAADGAPLTVSTRLVTRRGEAPGGEITVNKKLALDRDCDGDVGDERIQDALFEPVKDATVGDCVIFRVAFRHSGNKAMERIVVRDRVPPGTELRRDAVEILRTPEPLQHSEILQPAPGGSDVIWQFDGLFEPGAEGEVSYAVRLIGEAVNGGNGSE